MNIFMNFAFIVFIISTVVVLSIIVKIAKKERSNDRSPQLTVPATIISKRKLTRVSKSILYFVTFQVEGGDNFELNLDAYDYNSLEVGYDGKLIFKGSRFISFEREWFC